MKRGSIFLRYSLILLVLIISSFVMLNTFGIKMMQDRLVGFKSEELYEEATNLAKEIGRSCDILQSDVSNQLEMIASATGTRIWLLNVYGVVSIDTEQIPIRNAFGRNIPSIYPGFLDNKSVEGFSLEGLTSEEMLVVTAPIRINYGIRGYITLMQPLSELTREAGYHIDFVNVCLMIFIPLLIIATVAMYLISVRPVTKLTKNLKTYFEDNCKGELSMRYPAEIHELGGVVKYMSDKLNSFDETQRKFLSNVSHDFRSPLTSIRGYLDAMKDGTIKVEEQGKYFDILLYETDRLTKLTSNLLQLNNIDDNGLMLNKTIFDINAMIKQIALTFEGTFKKKKLVLNLIFSQKETFVEADADRIQQVIYNLLDNAIKFSGTDSSIKITTEEKGSKVYVTVKDFGSGIPKEAINRIWERFYKIDPSRGRDKKGSGLGLSIVKEIIKAHDQNISVASTEGVGTEFMFTLKSAE